MAMLRAVPRAKHTCMGISLVKTSTVLSEEVALQTLRSYSLGISSRQHSTKKPSLCGSASCAHSQQRSAHTQQASPGECTPPL
eukprot:1628151-Rhodomonas_salina.3